MAVESAAPRRNTFVYDCEDRGEILSITTRIGPGEIAVWPPTQWGGGYFVLGQVRSGSGSRYEGDGLMVWVKGDEALVEAGGELHKGCRLNTHRSIWAHARLSGVLFRGVGNEPGWSIEIREQRMDLEYDYGSQRLSVDLDPDQVQALAQRDAKEPEGQVPVTGNSYRIRGENGGAAVAAEIGDLVCNDDMSGERFDATVVVRSGERVFHGCGRWLNQQESHP